MKVSLQQVRNMDIFTEVQQPAICYHYSTKTNIEKILHDGKVRQFDDFMTYFFYGPEGIPVYLDLTGAYHGRRAYNTKGQIMRYPPVIPSECAVLKLQPAQLEPLAWYEERMRLEAKNETQLELFTLFDSIRVCHYGDLRFKPDPEIIELADVIEKYPYQRPEHLRNL